MVDPPPFDLDLLRTFVAIVDSGTFTRAAKRIRRTQSTVSLQVKKLEEGLGKPVFDRSGRELLLTPEGEILLTYARQMLRLGEEARWRLLNPDVAGVVRLGTPEDFATTHLPEVLARFARAHPRVALEVNCDFTVNLLDGFSKGQYDLVLFKREPQRGGGGIGVWREALVWAASPDFVPMRETSLPLVLAPVPDVYRKRALASLDAAMRPWRIVYTSPSLNGLQAAVRAGLGITVLPREMVTTGLVVLGEAEHDLPTLPDTEIVLYRVPGAVSKAVELLGEHILHSLGQSGRRAAEE